MCVCVDFQRGQLRGWWWPRGAAVHLGFVLAQGQGTERLEEAEPHSTWRAPVALEKLSIKVGGKPTPVFPASSRLSLATARAALANYKWGEKEHQRGALVSDPCAGPGRASTGVRMLWGEGDVCTGVCSEEGRGVSGRPAPPPCVRLLLLQRLLAHGAQSSRAEPRLDLGFSWRPTGASEAQSPCSLEGLLQGTLFGVIWVCWEAARIELLSREGERVHLRTASLERRSQLPASPKAESELLLSILSRV